MAGILTWPLLARAADATAPEDLTPAFAFHFQATLTDQGNFAFPSPYFGPNSLPAKAEGRETADVTAFVGFRPWKGAEVWVNPEFDQGFGLHNTLGVAAFPSGEAYKVGRDTFYLRLQRLFLRQTFNLPGPRSLGEPDLNQLAGVRSENRIVLTIGRFAVTDVFDTNAYAHDPRNDFLNWALIDTGTFDYAADAWGYTVGASAEWRQGPWTWRAGAFDLSEVPNGEKLDPEFAQFQLVAEVERRFAVAGRPGAIRATGFLTRGRMGRYDDAIAADQSAGGVPSTALVRHYRSRTGLSVNLEQKLSRAVGAFVRAGWAQGDTEPYEFTDIDRTAAAGVSVAGGHWGRPGDTLALAAATNWISAVHRTYLADGGLGILVGDGRLPHPASEHVLEAYYDVAVRSLLHLTVDYQFIDHPAYNADRGPVSIVAARLHTQF